MLTTERATAIKTTLQQIRSNISAGKLVELTNRNKLIVCFQQSHDNLINTVNQLQRIIKVGDKNIPTELRKIAASCNSVVQGLQDRACKRSEVIMLAQQIRTRLKETNGLISSIALTVTPITPSPTLAAIKKKNIVLNDLKDLDQYQEFVNLMKQQVKDFDRTGNLNNTGNSIKHPKDTTEPPPLDTQPIERYESNKESKRDTEEGLRISELLFKLNADFPKIKIATGRTYQRIKVPLLVVPQRFISPAMLQQARIDSTQLYLPEEISLGMKRGIRTEPSPLIIFNQWIMVVPLAVAMDTAAFNITLEYALDAMSHNLGRMMPMPVTAAITSAGPAAPTKGEFRTKEVTKYLELLDSKRHVELSLIKRHGSESQNPESNSESELDLTNFMPPGLKKVLDGLTPEKRKRIDPEKVAAIKQREFDKLTPIQQRDYRLVNLNKQINKFGQMVKTKQAREATLVDQERRRYFTNSKFHGLAFIWLVTAEQYSSLHQIRFLKVNFPDAPKPTINITKEQRENLHDEAIKLKGDLSDEINTLEKSITKNKADFTKLKTEQDKQIAILQGIANKKSTAYKTALGAKEITDNKIATLQGKLPALQQRITWLQKDITKRLQAAKLARNKK